MSDRSTPKEVWNSRNLWKSDAAPQGSVEFQEFVEMAAPQGSVEFQEFVEMAVPQGSVEFQEFVELSNTHVIPA